VPDPGPTHDDIREFFTAFRDALHVCRLMLRIKPWEGLPADRKPRRIEAGKRRPP
jgi:hypothetical protein